MILLLVYEGVKPCTTTRILATFLSVAKSRAGGVDFVRIRNLFHVGYHEIHGVLPEPREGLAAPGGRDDLESRRREAGFNYREHIGVVIDHQYGLRWL